MLEFLVVLAISVNVGHLVLTWFRVRLPKPIPIIAVPVAQFDASAVLAELHAMSRNTGARVHIHDIESAIRRAVG